MKAWEDFSSRLLEKSRLWEQTSLLLLQLQTCPYQTVGKRKYGHTALSFILIDPATTSYQPYFLNTPAGPSLLSIHTFTILWNGPWSTTGQLFYWVAPVVFANGPEGRSLSARDRWPGFKPPLCHRASGLCEPGLSQSVTGGCYWDLPQVPHSGRGG